MVDPRMHPRVELCLFCSPDQLLERVDKHLSKGEGNIQGSILRQHIMLKMTKEEQHFWSPVLNLDVEPHGKGTLLKGYFGPAPNVWTLFMAMYLFIGFSGLGAGMYGVSQILLERSPTAFWGVPIAFVLELLVYGIALVGQGLAQDQMYTLKHFFDKSICEICDEKKKRDSCCPSSFS